MLSAADGQKYELVDAGNQRVRMTSKQVDQTLRGIERSARQLEKLIRLEKAPIPRNVGSLPTTLAAQFSKTVRDAGASKVHWDLRSIPGKNHPIRILRATVPGAGAYEVRFDNMSHKGNAAPRFSIVGSTAGDAALSINRRTREIAYSHKGENSRATYSPLPGKSALGDRAYLVRRGAFGARKFNSFAFQTSGIGVGLGPEAPKTKLLAQLALVNRFPAGDKLIPTEIIRSAGARIEYDTRGNATIVRGKNFLPQMLAKHGVEVSKQGLLESKAAKGTSAALLSKSMSSGAVKHRSVGRRRSKQAARNKIRKAKPLRAPKRAR